MSERSEKVEQLMKRFGIKFEHLLAMRFAVNVGIGTWIVWTTLRLIGDTNPIWAIASMVASSDPQPIEARKMFKARLINVAVGCIVGILFLYIAGAKEWMLPFALTTTVLISSFIVRIKTMWRQAPITAAIVIASAINEGSSITGLRRGFHKVEEVIFGCLVGLLVSWVMSKFWYVQPPKTVVEIETKK